MFDPWDPPSPWTAICNPLTAGMTGAIMAGMEGREASEAERRAWRRAVFQATLRRRQKTFWRYPKYCLEWTMRRCWGVWTC